MGSPLPRVVSWPALRYPWPSYRRREAPASFRRTLVKSLQKLAAHTPSPHIGVDKDHGHVAISWDDRSSPVLRATRFSQGHRHHFPVRVEVADDQARLRL